MKKLRYALYSVIAIVFFGILFFNYKYNENLFSQPPSGKWSKEVTIGQSESINNPVLIKEKDRLLVAYDGEKKLHITETDLMGKVIKTKDYDVDEELIKKMVFLETEDGYILSYNSTKSQEEYAEEIYLDKDLNIIDKKIIKGVSLTTQANSSSLVRKVNDTIEFIETKENNRITIPENNIKELVVSETSEGILVCYLNSDKAFKFFTIKNGVSSIPKLIVNINQSDKVNYSGIACSSDKKYGYIVLEESVGTEFTGARMLQFKLDGSSHDIKPLYVEGERYLVKNVGAYSEEGAKFYCTTSVVFGKKYEQSNIISYIIEDGEVKNKETVTRGRELSMYPYGQEDYLTYIRFADANKYDINIQSTNEDFKLVNNTLRSSEKKTSLIYMFQGLASSLAYLFIMGLQWIMFPLVIAGGISFFDYSLSEKKKKIAFLSLAAITGIYKTYQIINMCYGSKAYLLPSAIATVGVGIIICIAISILTFGLGYVIYKRELENVMIMSFSIAIILDAILTLMVYVPYIV